MILPTKHVDGARSLIAIGAEVIRLLIEPKSVSQIWKDYLGASSLNPQITFDLFALSLDWLFMIGLVEFDGDKLCRKTAE